MAKDGKVYKNGNEIQEYPKMVTTAAGKRVKIMSAAEETALIPSPIQQGNSKQEAQAQTTPVEPIKPTKTSWN